MPSYLVSAKEAFVPTELYTPPIEAIGDILRLKQNRYDQAWSQANSMYRGILDAPLLSSHGEAKRQQFLKQADQAIQHLSTVDLSLPQNQQMANDVFKPFWEDGRLVKEIGLVKKTQSEIAFGEQMRTSTDEKVRAQYNPFSIQDLNNLNSDIKNSTPEELDKLNVRNYVKKVDIAKEMDQMIKDLGITNAQVRESPNGGGYKLVDMYGKESVLPLTDFFTSSLSTDARAYLQMMGRLQGHSSFEIALEQTNGDKAAARQMVADDIIRQRKESLEKGVIPEYSSAIGDAESKIRTIVAQREATGAGLSADDEEIIKQYTEAIAGYKTKLKESSDLLAGLKDKNSEVYQKHSDLYSTSEGYNEAYTSTIVGQYASSWAKSRANFLNSHKSEADAAWKGIQDVMTARMGIQARMEVADMNNDTKMEIADLKARTAARKAAIAKGEAVDDTPLYMGRGPQSNMKMTKAEEWKNMYQKVDEIAGDAAIRVFETTLNNKINLPFVNKLYEGVKAGMGDKAFFSKNDQSPEYKIFKDAIDKGQLKLEPGRTYNWTYKEVLDFIKKNTVDYMATEEHKADVQAMGGMTEDIKNLIAMGDIYRGLQADAKKVDEKILAQDKYKGYTVNENGHLRIGTADELVGEITIPMRNQDGQMENVKVSDILLNRRSINTESDNGVYVLGSGTTGRTYTSTININGKIYNHLSSSPNLMTSLKDGKVNEVSQMINQPMLQKLEELRADYNKDFERLAPSLQFSTPDFQRKNDMFNYGVVRYTARNEKSLSEPAEVAMAQLFSDDNFNNRYNSFYGVSQADLKEDSSFMKVVRSVASNLPNMSSKKDGFSLDVYAYDTEAGRPVYKPVIDKKTIAESLGLSLDKLNEDVDMNAAVDKFMKTFKVAAPPGMQPGDIFTGLSPIATLVRDAPYSSPDYLDNLKMGKFSIKHLPAGGGFQVSSYVYTLDPKTKEFVKTPTTITNHDESTDVDELLRVMYGSLYHVSEMNQQTRKANVQANPEAMTSIVRMKEQLKKQGININ